MFSIVVQGGRVRLLEFRDLAEQSLWSSSEAVVETSLLHAAIMAY